MTTEDEKPSGLHLFAVVIICCVLSLMTVIMALDGLERIRKLNREPVQDSICNFNADWSAPLMGEPRPILRRMTESGLVPGKPNSTLTARKEARILCWVMTTPEHYSKQAKAVRETWGRRCHRLLFMSSGAGRKWKVNDTKMNNDIVQLDHVKEGHSQLWTKTRSAFRYVYKHHRHEADWFLKADDDTYVVVPNLISFLSTQNSSDPVYFGQHFKPYVKQGYMSGGAGYVLSKSALELLIEKGLQSRDKNDRMSKACLPTGPAEGQCEDVVIGQCLEAVGVRPGDSRDSQARGRFFALGPEFFVPPRPVDPSYWISQYVRYPYVHGPDTCCSDTAISFHYVTPEQMYVMDYLIYNLKHWPQGHTSPARLYH